MRFFPWNGMDTFRRLGSSTASLQQLLQRLNARKRHCIHSDDDISCYQGARATVHPSNYADGSIVTAGHAVRHWGRRQHTVTAGKCEVTWSLWQAERTSSARLCMCNSSWNENFVTFDTVLITNLHLYVSYKLYQNKCDLFPLHGQVNVLNSLERRLRGISEKLLKIR